MCLLKFRCKRPLKCWSFSQMILFTLKRVEKDLAERENLDIKMIPLAKESKQIRPFYLKLQFKRKVVEFTPIENSKTMPMIRTNLRIAHQKTFPKNIMALVVITANLFKECTLRAKSVEVSPPYTLKRELTWIKLKMRCETTTYQCSIESWWALRFQTGLLLFKRRWLRTLLLPTQSERQSNNRSWLTRDWKRWRWLELQEHRKTHWILYSILDFWPQK